MIRIPYIKHADKDDLLFAGIDVAIWSIAETGLGIVAAAAATLRPLFRSFHALFVRNTTVAPHPYSTSKWRPWNSRFSGYPQNQDDNVPHHIRAPMWLSDENSDSIQLRGDVGEIGSSGDATVTSVRRILSEDLNEDIEQC
jgi:hypothetical protein